MENFNMLVLHTIVWRRWRRKRQNMWVHPINIKRPEFGIFSHLHRDLLEDEEKFNSFFFFRINIEKFYRLSQFVSEEIRKQNTNYRRAKTCCIVLRFRQSMTRSEMIPGRVKYIRGTYCVHPCRSHLSDWSTTDWLKSPGIKETAILMSRNLNFRHAQCVYAKCKKKRRLTLRRLMSYIYINSVALVRERTIPTERPPPVGEVSANFCG